MIEYVIIILIALDVILSASIIRSLNKARKDFGTEQEDIEMIKDNLKLKDELLKDLLQANNDILNLIDKD